MKHVTMISHLMGIKRLKHRLPKQRFNCKLGAPYLDLGRDALAPSVQLSTTIRHTTDSTQETISIVRVYVMFM